MNNYQNSMPAKHLSKQSPPLWLKILIATTCCFTLCLICFLWENIRKVDHVEVSTARLIHKLPEQAQTNVIFEGSGDLMSSTNLHIEEPLPATTTFDNELPFWEMDDFLPSSYDSELSKKSINSEQFFEQTELGQTKSEENAPTSSSDSANVWLTYDWDDIMHSAETDKSLPIIEYDLPSSLDNSYFSQNAVSKESAFSLELETPTSHEAQVIETIVEHQPTPTFLEQLLGNFNQFSRILNTYPAVPKTQFVYPKFTHLTNFRDSPAHDHMQLASQKSQMDLVNAEPTSSTWLGQPYLKSPLTPQFNNWLKSQPTTFEFLNKMWAKKH